MPELPEVETVKNVLKDTILNRQIIGIDVYYNRIIQDIDENSFKQQLVNKTFVDILRKGKFLIFVLSDNTYLISHLRMEGKYFIKKQELETEKHEHIVFHLDNGCDLRYHDTRKFGCMWIRNEENLYSSQPLSKLATDANLIGLEELKQNLLGVKRPIKEVLLEQERIAGIGNIYADEILFKSKIHPLTKACDLNDSDLKNIILYSKEILNEAIQSGGTTIRSYTSSLGVTGRFQQQLYVHTKDGEKCLSCGNIIEKMRVGGRGTYYCPHCQKL